LVILLLGILSLLCLSIVLLNGINSLTFFLFLHGWANHPGRVSPTGFPLISRPRRVKIPSTPPGYQIGWPIALRFSEMKSSSASTDGLNRRSAPGLHYAKQVQDDEYDSDNDQNMNPIAGFREA
jgi:hypothetical protein